MKKLKLIFVTLSLLLIGGSTAILISSIQSSYFLSLEKEVYKAIPPLKGEPGLIEAKTIPSAPMTPSFSVQDFPEPTVEVFQFTDHEMDLRGYGNDTVRFNMKFRSTTERAWFYGYAQLWTSDQTSSLSREAYWDAWVDPNTNTTASFDISGYELHTNGVNGPYSVCLRFYKENETTTTIYNSEFVHTSQAYLSTDFQARPTIDNITPTVIDADSNGLYEWVNVQVAVNITIPDYYYFSGTIQGGGVSEDARNDTYLTVGPHTVILKFAAWDFQGMSGSATISLTNLYLQHDTNPSYIIYSADPSVNIGTYDPTAFDTPPLELTNRFWGYGYDTDDNGLFNYYHLIIEVNRLRVEEGEFYLSPNLYKPPNDHIHGTSTNWVSLDSTGLVNVTVNFNGIEIYKSGISNDNLIIKSINGYFYHRPDVGYNWEDDFSFSDEFITSDTYHYSEFEGPGAELTHNFNDYGQDTDEDPLFNIVILEVEVNVSVDGDYWLGGWIEKTSNGDGIAYASTEVSLTRGIHWVTLEYDGMQFFLMAINEVIRVDQISLQGGSPRTTLDYNNTAVLSHYLFTEFDPPKARFTGIYSDTVADIDDDGLWDELRIAVEVEINQSGRYRLRGALRNPVTGQSVEYSTDIAYTGVGTVSFSLVFPGAWIWSQHTTTTYLLDYVYFDEYDTNNNHIREWDNRNDPFTTDTLYNSDDFIPPPVLFTGGFTESLVDIDSDGLSDFFQMGAEIEVTQALTFDIRVEAYLNIDDEDHYGSHWLYDLGVGTHWIEIRWSTIEMYQTLVDQTYTVDFYLDRTDNWARLDSYLDYETSSYAHTVFDPPSAEFTGNLFDSGVDTDIPSNGRFDFIELAFEVDILEAGQYRIYGCLYADDGGESYYFSISDLDLSTGLKNITVEIDYYWFLGHSSGTPVYISYVYLLRYFDNYGEIEMDYNGENRYLSRQYYHNEFEIPPVTFSDNISYDFGVDTDANGRFDYIELIIELNVSEAGTFWFDGWVYCDSGGNSFYFNSQHIALGVGLHNVSFEIDIVWVRGHDDGSAFYIGEMYLYEYISGEGDFRRGGGSNIDQYFNRIYYHNDFDPPDAYVSRVVEFYPVDFNSDDLYDVYRVVFEVNVTVSDLDLYIYSTLEEQNAYNHITSTSIELYDLAFGMHNISIDFRGNEIYSSSFTQGLQLSRYELTRISDWTPIDEFYDTILLTTLYTYEDFNPEYFPLIAVYHINVIENQFDQVEINATILRYSSESVDNVQLETEYGRYPMSRVFMGGNFEIWTYTFSPSSIDTYHFIVHAYGNWGSEDSMIYQAGGPAFIHLIGFQVNTTRGSVGNGFLFSARVNDSDGISEVVLHLEATDYPMNFIRSEPDFDLWQVNVTIDQTGTLTAYATATDGIGVSSNSNEITLEIDAGEPEIRSFTKNTTLPVTLGGAIHFEALVRDPDGIDEVILVTMGTEYSMNFVESSPLGELWDLEVTFNQAGELTAYIIVKDVYGISSQSDSLDIIVNEGSVIRDVDIRPGTKVKVDEEISFRIEIQKSDAIITSVTLEIEDDRGNDYLVPLEIIDETEDLEIYGGSYTPEHAGTFECTIRVLNTKNQESIYKVTIEVRSEQDITGTPGFELVVALGILVLLPLTRKRWKIKE